MRELDVKKKERNTLLSEKQKLFTDMMESLGFKFVTVKAAVKKSKKKKQNGD